MSITIDLTQTDQEHAHASVGMPPAQHLRPAHPGAPGRESTKRLLVLLNRGRMSRFWMLGIVLGARRLGIEPRICELGPIWERDNADVLGLTREMAEMVRRERIGAVVGYAFNGIPELHCQKLPGGRARSFFGAMRIPHLMFWSDHPQWASEKAGLMPEFQPLLRAPNNHHFLKSESAAFEIQRLLGWPHCHGLPVAEDPELVQPAVGVEPDFDVVAIVGSPPALDARLAAFLEQDDPDVEAIMSIVASDVLRFLDSLWQRDVPDAMQPSMKALGEAWTERRRIDVKTAAVRHLFALKPDHPEAVRWLLGHPQTYFQAVEHLWEFGRWQRTFVLRYLSRHFRVAVFGSDWSSVGIGGGGWVEHTDQASVYARGRIAINLSQGSDEEGVAHKPFQIAAAGVAMVHINRKGLSDCFEIGREVEVFDTPGEARDVIASLLADPDRRASMATAARRRLERDHTWERRLPQMLAAAGLPLELFQENSTKRSGAPGLPLVCR